MRALELDYEERLYKLQEECSEVIHIISKILRHGPHNYHPDDKNKVPNNVKLRDELIDLLTIISFCEDEKDFRPVMLEDVYKHINARKKMLKYMKYQV